MQCNIVGLDGKPTKYKLVSYNFVREESGFIVKRGTFGVGFTPYKYSVFRKTIQNTETGELITTLIKE